MLITFWHISRILSWYEVILRNKVDTMQKNIVKIFGIVLVVTVLSTVISSCKPGHEVCPAYTNVKAAPVNSY